MHLDVLPVTNAESLDAGLETFLTEQMQGCFTGRHYPQNVTSSEHEQAE